MLVFRVCEYIVVANMFTASKLSSLCYGFEAGKNWVGDACAMLRNESVFHSSSVSKARMSWGHENELTAFKRFEKQTGLKVTEQEDTKSVPWMVWGHPIATRSDGECKQAVLEIKSPFFKTYEEVPASYILQMMLEMMAYHKKKAYFIVHYTPHGWMKYVKYLHKHQQFDKIRDLTRVTRQGSNKTWEEYLQNPAVHPKTPKKTSHESFDIYQVDYSESLVQSMKRFVDSLDRFSFLYLRFVVQKPFLKNYYQTHLKEEIDDLTQCMDAMYTEITRVRLGITKVFKRSKRSRRSFVAWG